VILNRRGVQLLLLAIAVASGAYSRTAVSPLQEAMRIALSLTDNQMALLQGPAMAVPLMVASIPLGLAIDRYSRVRLLFIFAVLNGLGSVFTAWASGFASLFTARCLVGVAGFAMVPIALSLLADLYAPAQRGRVTTVVSVGQLAGSSAAFALGGMLLAMSGSAPDGWHRAMLWLGGPLAAVLLLTLALREPPRAGTIVENSSLRETWPELWRYRAVIGPLLIGMAMLETALGAVLIWTAPMLSRRFSLPPDRIGAIMAMGLLVSGALGPIFGGTVADLSQRTGGPRRTIYLLSALALLSVLPGLFAAAPGVASVSVLVVTFMTLVAAVAVVAMTLFTVVVPNELRGLCVSVSVATNVLFALGLAPLVVSLLSGAIGGSASVGRALALVCVAASLLGATAFAFGIRYFPRTAVQ
jgi:MFS family permease